MTPNPIKLDLQGEELVKFNAWLLENAEVEYTRHIENVKVQVYQHDYGEKPKVLDYCEKEEEGTWFGHPYNHMLKCKLCGDLWYEDSPPRNWEFRQQFVDHMVKKWKDQGEP